MNETKLNEIYNAMKNQLSSIAKELNIGEYENRAEKEAQYNYVFEVVEALENIFTEDDYVSFFKKYPELL